MSEGVPLPPLGRGSRLKKVTALWSYEAARTCELSFAKGDALEVVRSKKSGWMIARNAQGEMGEVPMNYFEGDVLTAIPDSTEAALDQDEHDDEYFRSYGQNMFIHWEMLSDVARTTAYRDALTPEVVKGKAVLDVGCGTGILSLFCARAGAKHVFAVDASEMAVKTRQIVAMNGYADVIEVIQASMAEVTLPYKVDLIVSEWMGTMLLFEAMLEDVIIARDKWLKRDGLMFPSWATMYVAGVSLPELWRRKIGLWDDVYGFDMRMLTEQAWKYFFDRPVISEFVAGDNVAAFDLRTASVADLQQVRAEIFGSKAIRTGQMHAILSWFDVGFGDMTRRFQLGIYPPELVEASHGEAAAQTTDEQPQPFLSTSPWARETHWRHALLVFKDPCEVREGDTLNIALDMHKNPDLPRHYHVDLGVEHTTSDFAFANMYPLWT